jgi:triacylglycerol lipase
MQVTFRSRLEAGDLGRGDGLPEGAPVLLLQGFFCTRRSLEPLERRLRRDGYQVFSLDLGGLAGRFNTRRIDELARYVRGQVERIYARNPGMPPLTVIGHSKGGLVASWWVKRLGGHARVRTVVTLGTPHRGTRIAWAGILLAWLLPSLLQMLPGSDFLRRLRDGAWPAHVALISLFSRRDRITPWPSALIESRVPHGRNVEVDAAHGDYLLKKSIYAAMVRELNRVEAREARPAPEPASSERAA